MHSAQMNGNEQSSNVAVTTMASFYSTNFLEKISYVKLRKGFMVYGILSDVYMLLKIETLMIKFMRL